MKSEVRSEKAPKPIGPYSQAVAKDGWVFLSGQIALDPVTGRLVGGGDAAKEAEQVLTNLVAVLEAAGATLDDVVKTTIFLTDLADFAAVNEAYGRLFSAAAPPARATVQVAALPKGAKVEIEMVAKL